MSATNDAYIGKRLSREARLCTVRFIGEVKGTSGQWLGVEWDDPTKGKHNGERDGIRYFECRAKSPNAASFIRPKTHFDPPRTFVEAVREKYASEEPKPKYRIIEIGEPPAGTAAAAAKEAEEKEQATIRFSGKEAEEVGFDKISKRLANLKELRIVLLDGSCVSRTPQAFSSDEKLASERLTQDDDAKSVIPNVQELDLSVNLFEEWREILEIASQLDKLNRLVVDECRFRNIELTTNEEERYRPFLQRIQTLSLNENLMTWEEIMHIVSLFGSLTKLHASRNLISQLDVTPHLPLTLQHLELEKNSLHTLGAVVPLTHLPDLRFLSLKFNTISAYTPFDTATPTPDLVFPSSITTLDLSHNAISTWSFIINLPSLFPGLKSLIISNNPLYHNISAPDGRKLTPEDGYMLTIARLPMLSKLNHSTISSKERFNAETYYLSLIAKELSSSPESSEKSILQHHPRYVELCKELGDPVITRTDESENAINPNSLAARLIKLDLSLGDKSTTSQTAYLTSTSREQQQSSLKPTTKSVEIPRSFTIYQTLGSVGRVFGLQPAKLRLFAKIGELEVVDKYDPDVGQEWDSEEENEENGEKQDKAGGGEEIKSMKAVREMELIAGTRSIGALVEGNVARVRVEVI